MTSPADIADKVIRTEYRNCSLIVQNLCGVLMNRLNQNFSCIKNSKAYDMAIAQANDYPFISYIRIICGLRRVKVYVKNIGFRVVIKASSFYKVCLGHMTFLLNSLPYREIKKAVITNPSLAYSRYITHKYFGLLGAISHQRKASNSCCQPSTMYSGFSIVWRSASRYSGCRENSGCSRIIFSDQTLSVSLTNLPNFDVACHNISGIKLFYIKREDCQGYCCICSWDWDSPPGNRGQRLFSRRSLLLPCLRYCSRGVAQRKILFQPAVEWY